MQEGEQERGSWGEREEVWQKWSEGKGEEGKEGRVD